MYLYFERSNGELILISEHANEDNAISLIHSDVEKRNPNYKIQYIRISKPTFGIQYDVGSWTEFYWLLSNKIDPNNIHAI